MDVALEAIKFNHQANSATNDGFSIRHNETRPLGSAEWESSVSSNSEDSCAAYALDQIENQTLSIQARISWSNGGDKLWIRTVDGNIYPERPDIGGLLRFAFAVFRPVIRRTVVPNVLGVVRAKQITQTGCFETFDLDDVRLREAGVGVYEIIWRWQFSTDGNNWTDFAITQHRIFSTLKLPQGKWQPNSDNPANTQLPWTDVLKYACQWAAGAKDEREIAARITTEVNNLGPRFIQYDDSGSPHYIPLSDPRRFDCQRFLNLLSGANHDEEDPNVNCDDCATIVSSFVSILGYALPVSATKPVTSAKFFLRRHRKIGLDWQDFDSFFHHTLAWCGGNENEVSDACIKLDASENGSCKPVPLLATNLPFGNSGEHFYRHLLAVDENCQYANQSTLFRCIGLSASDCTAVDVPVDVELVKRIYEYDKWHGPNENQPLLEPDLFFKQRQVFDGWTITSARLVPDNSAEFIMRRREELYENAVRIDAQFAKSFADTDEKILRTLARFERPGIKHQEETTVGENAFADDSGFVILFSRSNLILLLRNLTQRPIALWRIARFIDVFILGIMNQ